VANVLLEDDRLIEIDRDGTIGWEWRAADHIGELGFDAPARARSRGSGRATATTGCHSNSARYLGPTSALTPATRVSIPTNVIVSSRQASVVGIVARDGSIAWRIGPTFSASPDSAALGQVIGQHDAHLIPPGLLGAGNCCCSTTAAPRDGRPEPDLAAGNAIYQRPPRGVLEIDPVEPQAVWSYTAPELLQHQHQRAQRWRTATR
jgi:hypothetical protein